MRRSRCSRASAATALCWALAALPAQAHDTWLAWRGGAPPGQAWLAIGTGERFPRFSSPIERADVDEAGCRAADGRTVPLQAQRVQGAALWLQANLGAGGTAEQGLGCWAQTRPRRMELTAADVQTYLHEIRAPRALVDRWAEDAAAGAVWVERFSKHARIERHRAGDVATRQPSGLAIDIVIESAAPAVGQELAVRVLRDGLPLAGQALQLLGEQAPQGLWLQTDDQGRARVRLPMAGGWLLRGTDLRPPEKTGEPWHSRFMTLAFEVPEP